MRVRGVPSNIAGMDPVSELQRQQGFLIRPGTIAEVDLAAALCRVDTGEIRTDFVPWFVPRAGTTIEWSPPSVGEQVLLLSPGGDIHGAFALRGLYSNAFPAPDSSGATHLTRYPDGTLVHYDHERHLLTVDLGSGSARVVCQTATVEAEKNITLDTPAVNCTGSVVAEQNVHVGNGATGSFTTPTGQTVTVQDGIVTNIF